MIMATCVWREGEQAHSRDTGPWREGEELNSEGEKTHKCELCVCACVWRKSRKLLTERYAEREISMITHIEESKRDRENKKSNGKDLQNSKHLVPHIHIIIY